MRKYRLILKLGVLFICLIAPFLIRAQVDYNVQIKALEQSFETKSTKPIEPYISKELKFGEYPAAASPQILGQIFTNFPKLKSLETLESKKGVVLLRYDFIALGKRESSILFDEAGKITRLELVDNILREQAEAQKALASQKQAPTPGKLAEKYSFEKVVFNSADGNPITGNLYEVDPARPTILLCHQAGYNKYEYADIAPKLNEMGFNALAIDQRSGGSFAGRNNETFEQTKSTGASTEMVAAEPDLKAGVEYLYKKYNKPVILWGSSYSSSLALFVSAGNKNVKAVIAFSPGDYFGEAKASLSTIIPRLKKPFFITSSKQEAAALSELREGTKLDAHHIQFIPEGDGFHGSRALWEGQKGGEEYWNALIGFLNQLK